MLKNVLILLAIVVLTGCSGGPVIQIAGQCLADSQCKEGYFCNDNAKCEKMSSAEDGDSEKEQENLEAEVVEDSEASAD